MIFPSVPSPLGFEQVPQSRKGEFQQVVRTCTLPAGHTVANDWGIVTALSSSDTEVVLNYWSYKKAKFTMTWTVVETDTQ